ncbi:hypothetical protein GCM10023221_27370 [Luteimicrobium xylanilyticum]|uniref:Plasmid pRiA4b Orf3-like domain-containing protein n=1 Tax=Luteimicrobium xylanilyticum TaxID=1133546 RepID=A0A5P9QBS0_9MICO|nr:plasmid pRiA4b ORF-3 family protein [Luteimicrobium xylanilyticum]QFU98522.1 hypothetical protein KDY119_02038 [Luteimicrobium xylanilyticum]
MTSPNDDETLRRFNEAIAGMGVDDLRALTGALFDRGRAALVPPSARPANRRRPRRHDVVTLRVRVDLNDADPAIWRRLDLRSDLTLDVVHQVLQDAFAWTDSHLHRFALGSDVWDRDADVFLCPYDVEDPDGEDVGTPEQDVRLDETLAEPGDVLHYLYDYGDNWDVTVRLEEVLPADATTPPAVCIAGRRAAPPDDSGSVRDAESLAELLDDPAHFDPDELNTQLARPYYALRDRGFAPRLLELVNMLGYVEPGVELADRLVPLGSEPARPSSDELAAALRPHLWFLDRPGDGGIPLTAAGYLKPADVEAVAALIPTMAGWIGKANREDLTVPVRSFRESLVKPLGLLRKYRGRLLLTRAGAACRDLPDVLFDHLAARLAPSNERTFAGDADVLVLAHAAVSTGADLPLRSIASLLTEVGYQYSDGDPITEYAVPVHDGAASVLLDVSDTPAVYPHRYRVSPVAAALGRAALTA